ncbi:unnamed protein product [Arctogadus glacialis]
MPPTLDVALHVAEPAERELSDQPSLQGDDCQDQSGPAKHCWRRCGGRVDAAGAALSRGTTTVASQSGQDEERVRKPRPPDLERVETGVPTREGGCTTTGPPGRGPRRRRRPLNTRDCALGVGVVGTSDP